jgi:hypothetical protein
MAQPEQVAAMSTLPQSGRSRAGNTGSHKTTLGGAESRQWLSDRERGSGVGRKCRLPAPRWVAHNAPPAYVRSGSPSVPFGDTRDQKLT